MYFVLYLISWSFCNLLKYCLYMYINQVAKAHSVYIYKSLLTCLFWGIVGHLVFHPKEFPNYCWIICLFSVLSVMRCNLYYLL